MCKISVIIPVYNVKEYVTTAVNSILEQDLQNFEVILINDGSTDGSGDIIKREYSDLSNIKIIDQANQGLSKARNTGLMAAEGEYVLYLDSDDYFVKNSFSKIIKKIEGSNAELLFFGGNKIQCNGDGGPDTIEHYGPTSNIVFDDGIEAYTYMRSRHEYYTGVWLQLIKRDVLIKNKIGFQNGIIHEDHLYTFSVLMHAKKTVISDLNVYNYRIRKDSITTGSISMEKRFEGFAKTVHLMKEVVPVREITRDERRSIDRHIKELSWVTARYLCKMTDDEEDREQDLIQLFLTDCSDKKSFLLSKNRKKIRRLFC